jgi:hypothetical protein
MYWVEYLWLLQGTSRLLDQPAAKVLKAPEAGSSLSVQWPHGLEDGAVCATG